MDQFCLPNFYEKNWKEWSSFHYDNETLAAFKIWDKLNISLLIILNVWFVF